MAVSDPTNLAALDEIKFHTGINTDAILVERGALGKALIRWTEAQESMTDWTDSTHRTWMTSISPWGANPVRRMTQRIGRRDPDRSLYQQGTY
ncbi:MAG: hypothetical protein R3E50_16695 [Halioglobus sp.]